MADDTKRRYRKDMLVAATLVVGGLTISGASLAALKVNAPQAPASQQLAQATPPLQSTPGAESKPTAPAEPSTTGTRPSSVPPEPARPDADAQKAGAQPVLPPAPAEKTAPPIQQK